MVPCSCTGCYACTACTGGNGDGLMTRGARALKVILVTPQTLTERGRLQQTNIDILKDLEDMLWYPRYPQAVVVVVVVCAKDLEGTKDILGIRK